MVAIDLVVEYKSGCVSLQSFAVSCGQGDNYALSASAAQRRARRGRNGWRPGGAGRPSALVFARNGVTVATWAVARMLQRGSEAGGGEPNKEITPLSSTCTWGIDR